MTTSGPHYSYPKSITGGMKCLAEPDFVKLNECAGRNDRLLHALMAAYATMQLDSDAISPLVLNDIMLTAIANEIGWDTFQDWAENISPTESEQSDPTKFSNAVEESEHSDKFELLSYEKRAGVPIGGSVKVCCGLERFWATVISNKGGNYTAKVDNELFNTQFHKMVKGDIITFDARHVYDVYGPNSPKPTGPYDRVANTKLTHKAENKPS